MSNKILVINCGSSSLKFSVFDMSTQEELVSGIADRLCAAGSQLTFKQNGEKSTQDIGDADHAVALQAIMKGLETAGIKLEELIATGHRVVHGGEYFAESVLITQDVLDKIEACNHLAPLHNPANVLGIKTMMEMLPNQPQVAVFDTAFHQTIPQEAFTYPLPWKLYKEHGVRKYGFHGTSHRYVSAQGIEQLGLDPNNSGVIVAHLGNGCSATAVKNGQSIDTTMGLTPLEGLMMGTRSGDVDPSIHQYLADEMGMSLTEITNMLNKESGLLGISELSNDMRTLQEACEQGNEQAQLAVDVFCYRLAKQLGSLAVALGKVDALLFTGGIGENDRRTRKKVLNLLKVFNFNIDEDANQENGENSNGVITQKDSTIAAVIQTAEEWMIAKDTLELVDAK